MPLLIVRMLRSRVVRRAGLRLLRNPHVRRAAVTMVLGSRAAGTFYDGSSVAFRSSPDAAAERRRIGNQSGQA